MARRRTQRGVVALFDDVTSPSDKDAGMLPILLTPAHRQSPA
ncbi:hypothetical protein PCE31107_01492 [Pandoraea cepalis]|uniref:Uncharacterized protein n=1 Tax=Pandoraea cepalis TaxID=2508294 RepID=A0A5E4TKA1_9BURK|nr:hypothetical protein PCE31107_01492 [Pandoraea cepalis]